MPRSLSPIREPCRISPVFFKPILGGEHVFSSRLRHLSARISYFIVCCFSRFWCWCDIQIPSPPGPSLYPQCFHRLLPAFSLAPCRASPVISSASSGVNPASRSPRIAHCRLKYSIRSALVISFGCFSSSSTASHPSHRFLLTESPHCPDDLFV